MLFPDWLFVWLAIVGVAAFILGVRIVPILLIVPSIVCFGISPVFPQVQGGLLSLLVILTIPIVVFGGIFLLKKFVDAIYGRHAGGYVAGTYLVRVFDSLGGLLGVVVFVTLLIAILALIVTISIPNLS